MTFLKQILQARRVYRYQRDSQNLYIEEEQKTQKLKGNGQKDKQRSTANAMDRYISYWKATSKNPNFDTSKFEIRRVN